MFVGLDAHQDIFPAETVPLRAYNYSQSMSQKPGQSERTSWRALFVEFTQNATFHGLRYTTADTPFILRRFLWVCVLLVFSGLFTYIVVIRVLYFYKSPSSVDVEVKYPDIIKFPAVTICNQNLLKATPTFELGLYDTVQNGFEQAWNHDRSEDKESTCEDQYERFPEMAMDSSDGGTLLVMHDVTIEVCKRICSVLLRLQCGAFVYVKAQRDCEFLSEQLTVDTVGAKRERRYGQDYYRKRRCIIPETIECTFDYSMCDFRNVPVNGNEWVRQRATYDHTAQSNQGYHMTAKMNHSGWNHLQIGETIATSRKVCIQFFYQLWGSGKLQLRAKWAGSAVDDVLWEKENKQQAMKTLIQYGDGGGEWSDAFKILDPGVYTLYFSVVWNGDPPPVVAYIDDVTLGDCENLCDSIRPGHHCRSDQFQCDNGECILHRYTCDGQDDCGDRSDEIRECNHNVTCDFEDSYMCGYITIDGMTHEHGEPYSWTRHQGATPSHKTGPVVDHTTGLSTGSFVYAEASDGGLGDRCYLVSPVHHHNGTACLVFYHHLSGAFLGQLNVYRYFQSGLTEHLVTLDKDDISYHFGNHTVELAATAADYRIVFEATRGYGFSADIALDDISLTPGRCQASIGIGKPDYLTICNARRCPVVESPDLAGIIRPYTSHPEQKLQHKNVQSTMMGNNEKLSDNCAPIRKHIQEKKRKGKQEKRKKKIHRYGSNSNGLNDEDILFGNEDISLRNLYYESAHQKKDLIYRCSFGGETCSAKNFTTQLTDFGTCYTFNGDALKSREISEEGVRAGLSVILNIEEYEYMKGPTNDVGVKILLHDQNQLAMVRNQGVAAAPGTHTLIQIQTQKVDSLPKPWGQCGSKDLKFYEDYSLYGCQRECKMATMMKRCGCRDIYMPGRNKDSPPVCDLSTYFSCVLQTEGEASSRKCSCLQPCSFSSYGQSLSYADLSRFSMQSVLRSDTKGLKRSFLKARETQSRVIPETILKDMGNLMNLTWHYEPLYEFAMAHVKDESELSMRVRFAMQSFSNQFARDRDLVVQYLKDLEHTFLYVYEDARALLIAQRRSMDETANELLIQLHFFLLGEYGKHQDTLHSTITNFNTKCGLFEHYLRNYVEALLSVTPPEKALGAFSVPVIQQLDQLPKKVNPSNDSKDNCNKQMSKVINEVLELKTATVAALNSFKNKEADNHDVTFSNLRDLVLQFSKKHTWDDIGCLDQYYDELKETISLLTANDFTDLDKIADTIDWYTFQGSLEQEELRQQLTSTVEIIRKFSLHKIGKFDLVPYFSAGNVGQKSLAVQQLVETIKSKFTGSVREVLLRLKESAQKKYLALLRKLVSVERYFTPGFFDNLVKRWDLWQRKLVKFTSGSHVINPSTNYSIAFGHGYCFPSASSENSNLHFPVLCMKEHIDAYFENVVKELDIVDRKLNGYLNGITSVLNEMQYSLGAYEADTNFDEKFVRKNFLIMDIYYAELSYNHVEQMKAYDLEDLMGDIGGFMGLLLGASVITVFELLDLLLHNSLVKMCAKNKKRNNNSDKKRSYLFDETEPPPGTRV